VPQNRQHPSAAAGSTHFQGQRARRRDDRTHGKVNRLCQLAAGTVIAPGLILPVLSDADIERIDYDPPNRRAEASHRHSFVGAVRRIIEIRDRHCQHDSGCGLLRPAHNRIPQLRDPPRRDRGGLGAQAPRLGTVWAARPGGERWT
jgi:hypothetical protein